jgi:hypothetical protein
MESPCAAARGPGRPCRRCRCVAGDNQICSCVAGVDGFPDQQRQIDDRGPGRGAVRAGDKRASGAFRTRRADYHCPQRTVPVEARGPRGPAAGNRGAGCWRYRDRFAAVLGTGFTAGKSGVATGSFFTEARYRHSPHVERSGRQTGIYRNGTIGESGKRWADSSRIRSACRTGFRHVVGFWPDSGGKAVRSGCPYEVGGFAGHEHGLAGCAGSAPFSHSYG